MKTQCPHCNQHYEVDDQYNGQIIECQKCKQEFFVEPLRELPPKRKSEPSKAGSIVAVPKVKPASKQCPFCKAEIAGDAQKCCHCGEWVVKKTSARQLDTSPQSKKKHSGLKIVAFIIGFIFILLGIVATLASFKTDSYGLTEFDSRNLKPILVFLCGGVFIAIAPLCKLK